VRRRQIWPGPAGSLLSVLLCLVLGACATARPDDSVAEQIRQTERQRLRSLVDVDLPTARRLHSDDFQLINPAGAPLTKQEYLAALESGQLDYVAWEAGEISVKLSGDLAVIRYLDTRFDVNAGGKAVHRGPMYHTNVYERRGGAWRIVWSQASGLIKP
jgi:hypothetical protein